MELTLLFLAAAALAAWLYLLFLRGGFWQADQELDVALADAADWPQVVALVRLREDAEVVGESLDSLLAQDYPGELRLVLVDDNGRKGGTAAARQAVARAGAEDRVSIVAVPETPPGWSREVWALAQGRDATRSLAPQARYLWLTGADIVHRSGNLQNLVAKAEHERLDFVSLLPLYYCESLWERLLIPSFVFLYQKLTPCRWVNNPRRRSATAMRGCLLMGIEALELAGGFVAVKDEPAYDRALAVRVKQAARSRQRGVWLGVGEEAVSVRPLEEPLAIWHALAHDGLAPLAASSRAKAGAALMTFVAYLLPPLVVLAAAISGFFLDIDDFLSTYLALLLGCAAFGAMVFAAWPTFRLYDQPEWLTALLPVGVAFYTALVLWSGRARRNRAPQTRAKTPRMARLPGTKG